MRYWDASALVPLIVAEPDSDLVRGWLSEDDHIVTWVWTRTEIASAIERRTREGLLSRSQRRAVLERLAVLADGWDEVAGVLAVRSRAHALLARHPLRAADAGQLGAALLVQDQLAGSLTFEPIARLGVSLGGVGRRARGPVSRCGPIVFRCPDRRPSQDRERRQAAPPEAAPSRLRTDWSV